MMEPCAGGAHVAKSRHWGGALEATIFYAMHREYQIIIFEDIGLQFKSMQIYSKAKSNTFVKQMIFQDRVHWDVLVQVTLAARKQFCVIYLQSPHEYMLLQQYTER